MSRVATYFVAAALALGGPAAAFAQDAAAPQLLLELNALQPSDKGCRLTFVVNNKLGQDLSKAAFEIALFSEQGVVDRLSILDFGDLPSGKTKVTRFDLAGTDCTKIGRVLVNAATECVGGGIDPKTCMRALVASSRTSAEFGV